MRRFIYSIRKDIILQKKYILYLLPILTVAIIFISQKLQQPVGDFMSFLLVEFFGIHILFNGLALLEDNEYGRTSLIISPYCRDAIVVGRYLFLLIVFLSIMLIYILVSIITNFLNFYPVGYLNGMVLSITSIFISIWIGINLSLYYKMGYKKMKVIGNVLIFLSPFILPVMTEKLSHSPLVSKIDSFKSLSFLFICMALIIYLGSCIYSLKVFERRDL